MLDVDFTMDYSPDLPAMWWSIGFAIAFFLGAILLTVYRKNRSRRPGFAVFILLVGSALSLGAAYFAYFPSCPRNWWC